MLTAGAHELRIVRIGYAEVELAVSLQAGADTTLAIELTDERTQIDARHSLTFPLDYLDQPPFNLPELGVYGSIKVSAAGLEDRTTPAECTVSVDLNFTQADGLKPSV